MAVRSACLCSLLCSSLLSDIVAQQPWADPSPHRDGLVTANGIRLHYLDWGGGAAGQNETLLFLTGMGVTPHIFDDLAPKFRDGFRVLGLTRRGLYRSDKPERGYDTGTLTEDVLGFLDTMKIERVTLAGWSLAGTEMTRFAERHPDRLVRLVFLESAYDYAGFPEIWARDPVSNPPSPEDLASFEASRRWFTRTQGVWSDAVEADGRAINLQPDGSMRMDAMSESVTKQLMAGMTAAHPDFARIKVPVLAFYAVSEHHPGLSPRASAAQREKGEAYWRDVFLVNERAQMARFQRLVPQARVVELPGARHLCFVRPEDEALVVREMRRFLQQSK